MIEQIDDEETRIIRPFGGSQQGRQQTDDREDRQAQKFDNVGATIQGALYCPTFFQNVRCSQERYRLDLRN